MVDIADARPAIAHVGPGHPRAAIDGQQARVERTAAARDRNARDGGHIAGRLRARTGAWARGRARARRRAWGGTGRRQRTWAGRGVRAAHDGNGGANAAARVFDLVSAGDTE